MHALYIATENLIDTATLYSRAEDIAGLPRSNLQSKRLESVWRHTTDDATGLVAEFAPASGKVQCMALLGHNLTATGSILTAYSSYTPASQTGTSQWSSNIDPTDALIGNAFAFAQDEPAAATAYVGLQLIENGHADGFIQAGRLWAGPAIKFTGGWRMVGRDTGRMNQSEAGVGFPNPRQPFVRLEATISPETQAWGDGTSDVALDALLEAAIGQEIIVGTTQDGQASVNDGLATQRLSIYGELQEAEIREFKSGVYRISLQVEELF